MKIHITFKGLRMKGDPIVKIVGLRKIDLIMIQVGRFCAIFIPKPGGLIIRLKRRIHSVAWDVRGKWLTFRYWMRFRDQLSFRDAFREWNADRDDPESAYYEDRAAIHRIDGYTVEGGRIAVHEWTNDNQDQGVANESAEWDWTAKDRDAFALRAGRTRTGCSGVRVFVTLDGKRV